ncbi:MAG: glutamine--fructose-6-phosphate transaminase (isomerizing) [Bacilli bacterium]|nr:glutamine--fructose-6-phosphate transaminase (isomerizing) [Bacilli bacterium]
MCGIVGYIGEHQASDILLDGLTKLEYRGYDSAGVAVRNEENVISVVKTKGRIKYLKAKIENLHGLFGTSGIGHTRWATHGEPSEDNAHPHASNDFNVVAVHNGIIENYDELKAKLIRKGYTFYSDTDTEIAVKLIDYYYKKYIQTPCDAISKAMVRIRGSYALAVMFKDYPDEIWVARKDSPIVLGEKNGEVYMASDVTAILNHTKEVYYLDNMELARMKRGSISFFNIDGDEIFKEKQTIAWEAEAAEKGGYPHFMLKEIHEEPRAVKDTISSLLKDDDVSLERLGISDETLKSISSITVIGCGSAYHVGMSAQYVFEDMARIPTRVELASEYRYRNAPLDKNGLVVVISQSGETADSLAALRKAKAEGIKTLGIVNVVGSPIAREADYVIQTIAGPEIAVATTKAYSAQLVCCYALALKLAKLRSAIDEEKYSSLIAELKDLPSKIEKILSEEEDIKKLASEIRNAKDIFFIGREIDYATSLEGSLKMKEISYIHSEAYAAGELKHGTISLIEKGTPVVGILTQSNVYEKTISNLIETKTRGSHVICVVSEDKTKASAIADDLISIPSAAEYFMTSLAIIPLQLLSYYVSVQLGLNVDKPRNLAKSVTVE